MAAKKKPAAKKPVVKKQEVKKPPIEKKVQPVKKKVVKKKEVPESFTYNSFEFKRVALEENTPDCIKTTRKIHYDLGLYTKVLKVNDQSFLYCSILKRVGYKPKTEKVKNTK